MADVLNHGGDGGDEPPHQHTNRLQANCQTAPASKKRGPSRSLHLVKMFQSNGKKPLPIDFDKKEGTYLPTGENQKYLSRVVGTHVRQFVHPYFDRWANVPEEQNARATGCIYEFFDVNPRRYSKADYKLIVDGIEDTAARRYRQYKADVNAYIRDKGTIVPYRGLTTDVWEKCIERSSSQKFKRDRQTQEWPSVKERAAQDYNGKIKRSKLAPAAWQLTSTTLFLRSWERGRGHRHAVGRVLRGTSHSHSSTTRLRDQHSTSQSTKATNALNSKMETYMHQMNEFMTLLMSNLQSVMSGIQLPTPPPPPPLSLMHEEELDSSNDEDYLSDL
ncbi:Uncharacterized protein Adt_42443 [Abeliophyllum distichum]|uniref:Transposase, Ptta/En/Spm, plant n=1 Tax=Abeliophyllum distichum TaxID=126358 RepID=A0ABD1PRP6_9LAMI